MAGSREPSGFERGVHRTFKLSSLLLAGFSAALFVMIVITLLIAAREAITTKGIEPIFSSDWTAQTGNYGFWDEIKGTLYTSLLAIFIATIFGVAVALFISEDFLPSPIRLILKNVVELLAAIPSVIYGLWGIVVIVPLLREPSNWVHDHFGWFPLFSTSSSGYAILPASVVLAIMILPTVTALSRDALTSVPLKLREGSYGLGATRWETIFKIILPTASTGIFAAVILALGRALGETMALAMLVGNSNTVGWSLFAPGTTMAAMLALEFKEASGLKESMLMYVALVLLLITFIVNVIGSLIIRRASASLKGL